MARKKIERKPMYHLLFSDEVISPSNAEKLLQENQKTRNLTTYGTAHLALAARFGEGYFFRKDMQETFETTPSLVFPSGTTMNEAIGKLEKLGLLKLLAD